MTSEHLAVPDQAPRKRTYSSVVDDHEANIQYRLKQDHALLPSMLPKLETLVLTDVPPRAHTPDITKHITQFITDCSEEVHWAKLQASVGYALPPGRDRRNAERQYARSIFPLQRIVLEMAPHQQTTSPTSGWRRPSVPSIAMSSVQDPDCEDMWDAAQNDFSFFGGEECGQPDNDTSAYVPLVALTEKMTVVNNDVSPQRKDGRVPGRPNDNARAPNFDVLAEISRFRKEKKARYEDALASGNVNSHIEGYWEGEIIVIRPRR